MSRRKVLFIHETMNGGGAERVLLDLLRHMDYSRYDVTLLLVWATGVYLDQLPGQVKLLCINRDKKHWMERVLFRCKPLLDRWQRRDINRVLGDERYDTIVSFMEGPAMVYHSFVTSRAARNVTWVHTDMQRNRWTLPFHGNALREQERYGMMDEVVLVSQGAIEGFEAVIDNDVPHLMLHNPIDRKAILEKSRERSVEKRRFTVCNVGRLADEKRQDRIVRVAALLRDRGVEADFWIVGEGRNRGQLEDLIARCDVADRVQLLGFKENPYPYIAHADAFLLTSDAEGYPTVVCEALCLGKPVVSTAVAGVAELLDNGAGMVCEPSDEAIADAVQTLAEDSDLRSRCAQASQERGQQFDIDAVMQSIEKIL
ncbi:MAG: glycosyltransferase [Muribaculaceae bacterium]|nr:glycosyltransferase [Muribaculaceae bacterium]